MDVVASWTGDRADALRQALRMTNETFAGHLGVAVRTVAYWRNRPEIVPRPAMQEILDAALAQASEPVRTQFRLLLSERQHSPDQHEPVTAGIEAGRRGRPVSLDHRHQHQRRGGRAHRTGNRGPSRPAYPVPPRGRSRRRTPAPPQDLRPCCAADLSACARPAS